MNRNLNMSPACEMAKFSFVSERICICSSDCLYANEYDTRKIVQRSFVSENENRSDRARNAVAQSRQLSRIS